VQMQMHERAPQGAPTPSGPQGLWMTLWRITQL
jgi:hypothetical protein